MLEKSAKLSFPSVYVVKSKPSGAQLHHTFQGKVFLKLTLGPFLTVSVRNGPNLQDYLLQAYISLNPSRIEQKYTKHLLKIAKTIY